MIKKLDSGYLYANKINEIIDAVNSIQTDAVHPFIQTEQPASAEGYEPGMGEIEEPFCLNGFKCELFENNSNGNYCRFLKGLHSTSLLSLSISAPERCPFPSKRKEKKSKAEECWQKVERLLKDPDILKPYGMGINIIDKNGMGINIIDKCRLIIKEYIQD